MKKLLLTIIALLFFVGARAQVMTKTDSVVVNLKKYLTSHVLPPAVVIEDHIEGTVVVSFKVDESKTITDLRVVKSLNKQCDAEVLRAFRSYHEALSLSPAGYTAGVSFVIQDGKSERKTVTLNQSIYENFLFDLNVVLIPQN